MQIRAKLIRNIFARLVAGSLITILLNGCARKFSGPTRDTFENVPDSDFALWNGTGKKLTWNLSSYERAAASKLTYKQLVFYPPAEQEAMHKAIHALPIENILKGLKNSQCELTLLNDGRVLVVGRVIDKPGNYEPSSALQIIDPKDKSLKKLGNLQVPRYAGTVAQLKDGRVLFIGGDTLPRYADDETDALTNTVEVLDLKTGITKLIGRISEPRYGVIAEVIGDREILVVGGWNEYGLLQDLRYWPGAEIFRVPEKPVGK